MVAGPHIWNSLPASLRTATLSPLAFARHLKSHLFDWDGLFRTRSTNLRIMIIINYYQSISSHKCFHTTRLPSAVTFGLS